jgi:hypothetical protein
MEGVFKFHLPRSSRDFRLLYCQLLAIQARMRDLVVLTPHLVEKIRSILATDFDLPADLRSQLQAGLDCADTAYEAPEADVTEDADESEDTEESKTKLKPPTIDILALEHLSRWAASETITSELKRKKIDPTEYGMIPLLSGTELYIPSSQLPILPNETTINPFLPSYLSPLPPSFGSEYRSLTRQLSTVLNILFSIFGSGFAVYVAATTGGGYSREKGILLGILAGVVVGIADGVLVWIFGQRVKEGREESRKLAMKLAKGSGADGVSDSTLEIEGPAEEVLEDEDGEVESKTPEKDIPPVKKEIRLRRRAIGEKA